jgi:ParB-like nuclease domain
MEIKIVNLDSIVPPIHQPRSQVGDVSDLVTAITSTYVFNSALAVKRRPDGRLQIICGERRYQAMQQAVASHSDLPALISVIIYEQGELTPDLEWMLALDENRVRRPLTPVDEARAVVELKLRIDCMELRRKLEGVEGWQDDELPPSLEAWQTECDRLTELARGQGRSVASILSVQWQTLEEQLHLKERDRRRMQQLAATPAATQEALSESDLGARQQIAITYAPTNRQVELIEATRQAGRPDEISVAAIYAAAHALADERTAGTPAAQVLNEALRLYRLEPKQSPKDLCAAAVSNLTRAAEEFGAEESSNTGNTDKENNGAEGETQDEVRYERRELSTAEAGAFIDRELESLQGKPAQEGGQATGTRPPTLGRPQRAPVSESEKLGSLLDTIDRAVDHFLAAHRYEERERVIARLREMLRRLETAE